jgi:hypothetical protein
MSGLRISASVTAAASATEVQERPRITRSPEIPSISVSSVNLKLSCASECTVTRAFKFFDNRSVPPNRRETAAEKSEASGQDSGAAYFKSSESAGGVAKARAGI